MAGTVVSGIVVIGTLVYAWAQLDTLSAVLISLWMLPASGIDNVLKPIVMSRGLPVPMLVILADAGPFHDHPDKAPSYSEACSAR